ncbi:MAG TPA: DUF1552 domain-containing protein [Planctomycetota bacterium]
MNRRTLLRGAGVAIGLPWLEAMAAVDKPPVRLMFVYAPGGFLMKDWLTTTLEPLDPSDVLILSGLDSRNGEEGGNGHPAACAPWLSSAPINKRDAGGYCTELSVDQILARRLGESTRLASLELGTQDNPVAIHTSNISWRAPGSPMGKEVHPRAVFSRLFGDPKGDKYRKSVLDFARDGASRLRESVGAADRHKMDEYLDSVRSIEKRIQFVEKNNPAPPPKVEWLEKLPDDAAPRAKGAAPGIPIREHIEMLSELVALGFQADSTRVVTFMYGNEDTFPALPEIGAADHHGLAHAAWFAYSREARTAEEAAAVEGHKKVDRWKVERFAHLLRKLKAIREGDGTLLDNCLILFGSGLSWGGGHLRTDLPLVLAGGGGGQVRPGRRLRFPKGTPLPNLYLSMLDAAGVKLDRLADSTGRLPGL